MTDQTDPLAHKQPRNPDGTFREDDTEEKFWALVSIPHGGFGCWNWKGRVAALRLTQDQNQQL